MAVILYELCGADNLRFSPFCWRTRLALRHKKIQYKTIPVKFTEKYKLRFSNQDRVPVLNDSGTIISDSWAIAKYLEDAYSGSPALFPGSRGELYAKMTNDWMDKLNPIIHRSIITNIYEKLDPPDKKYFRQSREARFGTSLEQIQLTFEESKETLYDALSPLRAHLMDRPFVSGTAPAYSDFSVFGTFRWIELVNAFSLISDNDLIYDWYARMRLHMNIE